MRAIHIKQGFIALGAAAILLGSMACGAQQVTGILGTPSATTTIPGNQLPAPPPKFGGLITPDAKTSKPWWPPTVVPPKGAPNVLLIMTDDSGFGVPSTFGGVIPTPALDRIAKAGLRYTQFHSTALCSPTRAAIITGRNHHAVGFGMISEMATGFPGYDSIIGPDNATIGRILSENGYATSWFGKNHNTPAFLSSVAGPFDQWPSGMGFQYFYGFMGDTWRWTGVSSGRTSTRVNRCKANSSRSHRALPVCTRSGESKPSVRSSNSRASGGTFPFSRGLSAYSRIEPPVNSRQRTTPI